MLHDAGLNGVQTSQAAVDEHREVITAALELRDPVEAEARNTRAPFAVPPSQLPLKHLPQDAAVALRAVLPAWRAALSAGELFLDEQMPTPDALKVRAFRTPR